MRRSFAFAAGIAFATTLVPKAWAADTKMIFGHAMTKEDFYKMKNLVTAMTSEENEPFKGLDQRDERPPLQDAPKEFVVRSITSSVRLYEVEATDELYVKGDFVFVPNYTAATFHVTWAEFQGPGKKRYTLAAPPDGISVPEDPDLARLSDDGLYARRLYLDDASKELAKTSKQVTGRGTLAAKVPVKFKKIEVVAPKDGQSSDIELDESLQLAAFGPSSAKLKDPKGRLQEALVYGYNAQGMPLDPRGWSQSRPEMAALMKKEWDDVPDEVKAPVGGPTEFVVEFAGKLSKVVLYLPLEFVEVKRNAVALSRPNVEAGEKPRGERFAHVPKHLDACRMEPAAMQKSVQTRAVEGGVEIYFPPCLDAGYASGAKLTDLKFFDKKNKPLAEKPELASESFDATKGAYRIRFANANKAVKVRGTIALTLPKLDRVVLKNGVKGPDGIAAALTEFGATLSFPEHAIEKLAGGDSPGEAYDIITALDPKGRAFQTLPGIKKTESDKGNTIALSFWGKPDAVQVLLQKGPPRVIKVDVSVELPPAAANAH